jgi:hypothetical protein
MKIYRVDLGSCPEEGHAGYQYTTNKRMAIKILRREKGDGIEETVLHLTKRGALKYLNIYASHGNNY